MIRPESLFWKVFSSIMLGTHNLCCGLIQFFYLVNSLLYYLGKWFVPSTRAQFSEWFFLSRIHPSLYQSHFTFIPISRPFAVNPLNPAPAACLSLFARPSYPETSVSVTISHLSHWSIMYALFPSPPSLVVL